MRFVRQILNQNRVPDLQAKVIAFCSAVGTGLLSTRGLELILNLHRTITKACILYELFCENNRSGFVLGATQHGGVIN